MNYLQSIILSIVEGITEFLPISSTGHLILFSNILKISQTEFIKSFEIIIQLGAILAVVVIYWKTLIKNVEVWKKIMIAFLPTGILGFALYKLIKKFLLGNTAVVLWSLLIGGILLIILEVIYNRKHTAPRHLGEGSALRIMDRNSGSPIKNIEDLTFKKAFLIGLFQSVSMIPGVSRSAATIFGGLFLGLERKTAVEFSFLLAVPTMAAATGLDLVKRSFGFTANEFALLTIGFLGAFITAFFTVKYFLRYIEHHTFIPFGIYRILIATLFWLFIVKP